jgi:hypothetical protein
MTRWISRKTTDAVIAELLLTPSDSPVDQWVRDQIANAAKQMKSQGES